MTIDDKTQRRRRKRVKQRLFTVQQAALYLGRTVYALREIYYSGKLPVVKIDGRIFIDVQDLDRPIEQSKVTYDYE